MRKLPYFLFAASIAAGIIERNFNPLAVAILAASAIILYRTRDRSAGHHRR